MNKLTTVYPASRLGVSSGLLPHGQEQQFYFTHFIITMTPLACPACTLEEVLSHADHWECATCGHEWTKEAPAEVARVVKDANGTPLTEGDTVALIKDLKLGSGSQVLKAGTKAKNIRLQDGDHEIACKIDGSALALKACFVKKV
jgi:protein PhnA